MRARHKSADFREPRFLKNFDFSFNQPSTVPRFMNWPPINSRASTRDVLLIGPHSVGKSHLVQAIGLEAIKAGFVVLYRSIFDLVPELLAQEASPGRLFCLTNISSRTYSSLINVELSKMWSHGLGLACPSQ